jgi:hypothetical protein
LFEVDTLAKPPRAIWVHPFKDPQFVASIDHRNPSPPETTCFDKDYNPNDKPSDKKWDPFFNQPAPDDNSSYAGPSTSSSKHRGFLGKLKDKALGSKEEKELSRKAKEEEERLHDENMRALIAERMREQRAWQEEQRRHPPQRSMQQFGGFESGHSSHFGGNGRDGAWAVVENVREIKAALLLAQTLNRDSYGR